MEVVRRRTKILLPSISLALVTAIAGWQLRDELAVHALLWRFLHSQGDARDRAAGELVALGRRGRFELEALAFSSEIAQPASRDFELRQQALDAIWFVESAPGQPPVSDERLIRYLVDARGLSRSAAIDALVERAGTRASPPILGAALSTLFVETDRRAVAACLYIVHDRRAVKALAHTHDSLAGDDSRSAERTRAWANGALERITGETLGLDESWRVRLERRRFDFREQVEPPNIELIGDPAPTRVPPRNELERPEPCPARWKRKDL
jgi:hypothetical protein